MLKGRLGSLLRSSSHAKRKQKHVILAVTFGSILEWYDIYSYAYFVPVAAKIFFNFESNLTNIISGFVVFGSGFLARPFGAILFGRIGDLIGRKKAFTLSILLLILPTTLIGCLPTYATIGIYAPILLGILRLLQSIPTAGEVPGAVCFLYEYADLGNRRWMASWAGVGNQVGAILAVAVAFIAHNSMSEEIVLSWGWRTVFWFGGVIGLFGVFLRSQLQETPVFKRLEKNHELNTESTLEMINKYKKKIGIGIGVSVANAATFYLVATYIPVYFNDVIGLGFYGNLIVTLTILILTTVFIPMFGRLGDRFSNKKMLILSALSIILTIFPFYYSVVREDTFLMCVFGLLFVLPITCMTALLAYVIANLFPAPVRFSGFGLTYNLSDGIVGGFTPAIALLLLEYTGNQGAFCWYILACTVVSLFYFFKIKD